MSFNPFENEERSNRKGDNLGGNFVEHLGGDYIAGSVFNFQGGSQDPLEQEGPPNPQPRQPRRGEHRTINLNGGIYNPLIDGDYIQGQRVNFPSEDVLDVDATSVDADDDDAW